MPCCPSSSPPVHSRHPFIRVHRSIVIESTGYRFSGGSGASGIGQPSGGCVVGSLARDPRSDRSPGSAMTCHPREADPVGLPTAGGRVAPRSAVGPDRAGWAGWTDSLRPPGQPRPGQLAARGCGQRVMHQLYPLANRRCCPLCSPRGSATAANRSEGFSNYRRACCSLHGAHAAATAGPPGAIQLTSAPAQSSRPSPAPAPF
jgi:hypothetical protein